MRDWFEGRRRRVLIVAGGILAVAAFFGIPLLLIDHREVSTSWDLRGVSEDGKTVTVGYLLAPSCDSLERVEKRETTSKVTITVIIRQSTGGGGCDVADFRTTEVELARRLGSRTLIDGRAGAEPGP
jgi:hypothetical protein